MRQYLIFTAGMLFVSLSASAQLQTFRGDTAAASTASRVNIGANASGRVGQKLNTGSFSPFALLSEVVAATGGAITNVNGQTGPTVTLTTANVAEGVNLYYTQARARSALSGSAPITYNTSTGAIGFSGTGADVGLGNVNNTSDANKPVSTATQAALDLKENSLPTGTTAQYFRGNKTLATLDKAAVGLANVDNTTDAAKPISTATQTALNLKANLTQVHLKGDVATRAALDSYTVPAGDVAHLVLVRAVATQTAPYDVNQFYIKDSSGNIYKLALIKE